MNGRWSILATLVEVSDIHVLFEVVLETTLILVIQFLFVTIVKQPTMDFRTIISVAVRLFGSGQWDLESSKTKISRIVVLDRAN